MQNLKLDSLSLSLTHTQGESTYVHGNTILQSLIGLHILIPTIDYALGKAKWQAICLKLHWLSKLIFKDKIGVAYENFRILKNMLVTFDVGSRKFHVIFKVVMLNNGTMHV